jgi:NifU-like protein involved in Fe-S cluster formation
MGQKRAELLQAMGYPEKAVQFILNETNVGEISDASVSAKEQGTCGDIMILHLLMTNQVITEAKYDYIGCAGLQAAASALTEMIRGMHIQEAGKIESHDIIDFLGGLPPQKHECALLASRTLKKALESLETEKNSS